MRFKKQIVCSAGKTYFEEVFYLNQLLYVALGNLEAEMQSGESYQQQVEEAAKQIYLALTGKRVIKTKLIERDSVEDRDKVDNDLYLNDQANEDEQYEPKRGYVVLCETKGGRLFYGGMIHKKDCDPKEHWTEDVREAEVWLIQKAAKMFAKKLGKRESFPKPNGQFPDVLPPEVYTVIADYAGMGYYDDWELLETYQKREKSSRKRKR